MQKSALTEAGGFAQQVLAALQASISGPQGQSGATLFHACGQLSASAEQELASGAFWADFAACFDDVRLAGASFSAMERVRTLASGFAPKSSLAIAVTNLAIRMALAEEAQILAATTFTDRAQIDDFLAVILPAFEAAELVAADNLDNVAYTALVALRGAVVNDLSTRAFTLPTLVTYQFGASMPALWLAQRLYQDASRESQLAEMNNAIHPLFMPRTIAALTA